MNIIKVPKTTEILVAPDSHEHVYQVKKLLELYPPNKDRYLCFLGDIKDKGFKETHEQDFLKICDLLMDNEYIFSILGNHDFKLVKKTKSENRNKQIQWLASLPLSRIFEFENGKRLVCIHAGITPKFTERDLEKNIEIMYVRKINSQGNMIPLIWKDIGGVSTLVEKEPNGTNWHELYQGDFGYICAGHWAQKDGIPKYFNYSCNLDCSIYSTGKLCVQFFTGEGNLGKQIFIEGPFSNPELHIGY